MGKSSSSLKKKRSKKSSKDRTSSKIKSRKSRSKKLRRREVYLSSSDSDHSESMSTSISSSSDDSYRRRRARSRIRKDVKGHRKKAQRRSYCRDSSEDSPRVRKRRRSKRKNVNKMREKPHGKKKLRREASVSSMSGRSWSCSTCQGGDSGSDGSGFERSRGRSERIEKDKRRLERGRSESVRTGRYRARSCSSCSPSIESPDEITGERYMCENNSRRLKSVITVIKGAEEGRELFRNESKEEIVDDHDYPSRSNDSNDGVGKRDPSSDEKVSVEDEKGDEYAAFSKKSYQNNFTNPRIRDKSYDDTSPYGRSNIYGARTSESMEKKTSDVSDASLDDDDLESILRQRAIANLRKFRGDIKLTSKASDQENEIGSNLKQQPITEKHDLVQGKLLANNEAVGENLGNVIEGARSPMGRRGDSIPSSRNNERSLNGDKGKPGSAKHHPSRATEKVMNVDNPSETVMASDSYRTNKSEFNTQEAHHHLPSSHPSLEQRFASDVKNVSALRSAVPKQSSNTLPSLRNNVGEDENKEHSQYELKQTSASREPSNMKSVMEGDVDKDAAKTAQAAIQVIHNNAGNPDKFCDSGILEPCDSVTGEDSSNKLQDEANQGSQFEQKTMNVMRGGEMVQVSYKVYIPKKAPALARRQLKR